MPNEITGYRLSPQQARLWTLVQEGTAHPACCAVTIDGPLDAEAAREALDRIVQRHEILRTTFHRSPGVKTPIQVINDICAPSWTRIDLRNLNSQAQEGAVHELYVEQRRRSFDLERGPLVHSMLVEISPERNFLIVSLSPLCADGGTLNNLVEEIAKTYGVCLNGGSAGADEPLQYIQFAEWQNDLINDEEDQEGRDYWRKRGAPAPADVGLPFELKRRRGNEFDPNSVEISMQAADVARTASAAAALNTTTEAYLFACWQALLWRITGDSELVIGSNLSGRRYDEMRSALGPFAKCLPLQSACNESATFIEVVRQVEEELGGAGEWQEHFAWDASSEDGERAVFLPLAFEFSTLAAKHTTGDVSFWALRQDTGGEPFKVKLCCFENENSLNIEVHYDATILRREDAQRLAGQFQNILQSSLDNPGEAVTRLEILTPAERQQLLIDWNCTAAEFPSGRCVHLLFEEQAELTPDSLAVAFGGEGLSYAELNRRANQLGRKLQDLGVRPETLVGVMMERSIEMVVALLGVLKAGGGYVPLDASYPRQRLAFMLDDASVEVILTQQHLLAALPDNHAKVFCLTADWTECAALNGEDFSSGAVASNLAYVIYTSGSTGLPKGVMIPHRGLVNYLHWCVSAYRLDEGSGAPVHSPIGFDLTITSIFAPLLAGRCTVMLREDTGVEPLVEALRQGSIYSLVKLTPAHLEVLGHRLRGSGYAPHALVIGGEALTAESLAYWRTHAPATRLINEYGPTETVVGCCVYEVPPADDLSGPVPIGRPVANTQLYILDDLFQPAPIEVAGELYIGGAGVARGYLNRPELTAERFVPHPYEADGGTRLYRSGDLARYRDDGTVEFLGRVDHQVKVRGFRIELGEIESVLAQQDGVRECTVIASEDTGSDKRLVAYIVPASDREIDLSELRGELREKLPHYMIPSHFFLLGSMPLTPNGKVDRRALLSAEAYHSEANQASSAPGTMVEELLAAIWAEVLRCDRVRIDDNFFEVGGHSLLATQLMSRVRETFQVEVPLRVFFDAPTIIGLAENIDRELKAGEGLVCSPITRRGPETQGALSFAQQRLWFLSQFETAAGIYNVPCAVRLTGRVNVLALGQSLTEIARRHEVLRAAFLLDDGQPKQVVLPPRAVPVGVVDVQRLSAEQQEREVKRRAIEIAQRPFDLESGQLFRVVLIRLADDVHLAVLVQHHMISDGWSTGLLLSEMEELYRLFAAGSPSALTELPIQYADYAAWQREWLQGDVLERQLDYWKEQVAGVPVLELQTDHPRPAVQSYRGAAESLSIPHDLAAALKKLSQHEGATLFMALLAAFKILLYRHSGQESILVGADIANRNRVETESLIGFFVNMTVLRTDLSGDLNFREILGRVREAALAAHAHQDLPFEKLVEAVKPERSLGYNPIFQVGFVLQNVPMPDFNLPGLTVSPVVIDSYTAKFDLMVDLCEEPDGLNGSLVYSTDLFEATTIRRMAGHFRMLVEGIVSDPEQRISELPLLTAAEQRQLADWNNTATEYPRSKCIHELFDEQVRLGPDALAVLSDGQQLTYKELNKRASQLAHYLQANGVGPEVPVSVCLERGTETIICLLGILKAGGAYVPLDPSYPLERLSFMLTDTAPPLLLTEKSIAGRLPTHWGQVVCIDSEWEEIACYSSEPPASMAGPDNLAYVMYTSGSTGTPKGIAVTHGSVVRLVRQTNYFELSGREVFLQLAPVTFDASTFEIWGSLLNGATLAVMPADAPTLAELSDAIQKYDVSTLWLTAGLFHLMVDEEIKGLSGIRQLLAGGDVLSLSHVEKLLDEIEGCTLINGYGPTESTTFACCHVMTANASEEGSVPIGRAISNTRLYILDERLNEAPAGVAGELYIGGAGLARNYVNRGDLTAERFIPDPFAKEAGGRLYRTGDRVRYLATGVIEYFGRIDRQVKISGFRIELGEIEAVLNQRGDVREAIVLASEDQSGAKKLIAYLACKDGKAPSAGEFREYLKNRLPDYMIPAAFYVVDAIPLTPNGKIDREALRNYEEARAGADGDSFVAPSDPVEEALAAIWSQTLGVDRIGVHDNFFDLGGDSIRSIKVAAQARKVGLDVSVQQLFLHQTVGELAKSISASNGTPASSDRTEAFSIVSSDDRQKLPEYIEDAFPLAMLQAGMVFHTELDDDTPIYHDILSFHLRARFNNDSLQEAWRQLTDRHPMLRTSFDLDTFGEPVQLVHRSVESPVRVEDIRHLTPAEQTDALAEWIEADKKRGFDWTTPPLLRVQVYRRTEETFQFVMSFHHAILDGWSVATMLTELFENYESLLDGNGPIERPVLNCSFRDFVAAEREVLRSTEAQQFWKNRLTDLTVTKLPRRSRALEQDGSHRTTMLHVGITEELSDSLKGVAQMAGVPIKNVLLAAHLRVLGVLSGQTDVVTGVISHGRLETVDGENVVGLFLNTLPFRQSLPGGSWIELAQETFKTEREMFPFRRYPLARLQKENQGESLYETAFNFLHFHAYQGLRKLKGAEALGSDAFEQTNFAFAAIFGLDVNSSAVSLRLDYDTRRLTDEQVGAISGYYTSVLEAMGRESKDRYECFSPLSSIEREHLLLQSTGTEANYSANPCLHELFEAQVERTPDAVALAFENERLTYESLNLRANQVAHRLRELGVKPDMPVAILMERSIEMVVSLLAVIKSGGAYVPLDPGYPQERLLYMLTDAAAPVLLTQQRFMPEVPAGICSEVIYLDGDWSEFARQSDRNPVRNVTAENLAYTIYTSGSTGRPKGAMNTHRGICNRLAWMQEAYQLTASDVVLQKTPFSFDVSVWEFFWPLITGARLVVARPGGHQDTEYLVRVIIDGGITTLHFVPSMLGVFLEDNSIIECDSIRRVICSGESLGWELQERYFSRLPWTRLENLYGPTEAAVDVTAWTCRNDRGSIRADAKQEAGNTHLVPIGRPIANTRIYILDRHLQPAPGGVAGELFIGGDNVSRGYLRRPELTAERFIPDPLSEQPDERLYRTGDLARYLADGEIEFIGRIDHQVKLRGYRIELGEIEAALEQHPGVAEATVTVREDERGHKRLVAYVVPDERRALTIRHLLRFERENLLSNLRRYELPNGLMVIHRNKGETDFLYEEIFQEQVYLRNGIRLERGDCIFDVGANIGLFSLFVGRACEDSIIYAFEPIPPLFEILRANAALHGLNVKPFECGLAAESKTETFTYYPHCTILSGRFADEAEEREVVKSFMHSTDQAGADESSERLVDEMLEDRLTTESFACRLTTISNVIRENNVERIDLLKIDAEKSEVDVLAGIEDVDWQKIRQLIVEVHDVEGRLDNITSLLKRRGYRVTVEQDRSLEATNLSSIYAVREFEGSTGACETRDELPIEQHWASPNALIADLRGFLKSKLPEYMAASSFVLLDAMPLTPNGKVDRQALPIPDGGQSNTDRPYIAPRSPVEQELAQLWSGLLGIERVGIHDHFFEMGGHSLLLTQLGLRIRKAFRVSLPLRALFDAPTLHDMASAVVSGQIEQLDRAKFDDLIKKLKQLSPSEMSEQLQAER